MSRPIYHAISLADRPALQRDIADIINENRIVSCGEFDVDVTKAAETILHTIVGFLEARAFAAKPVERIARYEAALREIAEGVACDRDHWSAFVARQALAETHTPEGINGSYTPEGIAE